MTIKYRGYEIESMPEYLDGAICLYALGEEIVCVNVAQAKQIVDELEEVR